MTTLKDLIEGITCPDIEIKMQVLYPDYGTDGYASVLETLHNLTPIPNDMVIHLTYIEDLDFDNYIKVDGIDGEDNEWGLDFMAWEKWLGMQIDEGAMAAYTPIEIVVHCLWEMTFYGFDQETIETELDLIEGLAREAKEQIRTGTGGSGEVG